MDIPATLNPEKSELSQLSTKPTIPQPAGVVGLGAKENTSAGPLVSMESWNGSLEWDESMTIEQPTIPQPTSSTSPRDLVQPTTPTSPTSPGGLILSNNKFDFSVTVPMPKRRTSRDSGASGDSLKVTFSKK